MLATTTTGMAARHTAASTGERTTRTTIVATKSRAFWMNMTRPCCTSVWRASTSEVIRETSRPAGCESKNVMPMAWR